MSAALSFLCGWFTQTFVIVVLFVVLEIPTSSIHVLSCPQNSSVVLTFRLGTGFLFEPSCEPCLACPTCILKGKDINNNHQFLTVI